MLQEIERFLGDFDRVRNAALSLPSPSDRGEVFAMLEFAITFFDVAVSRNKPEIVCNLIMASALRELQAASDKVNALSKSRAAGSRP